MILILNIISLIVLLLNVFFLKNTLFGVVFLILWSLISGYSYKIIIEKYFKNIYFPYLFGIFAAFYSLCFFGSIFTVLYKITPLFFVISLILATLLPLLFIKKDKLLKLKFKIFYPQIGIKLNINSSVLFFGFFSFVFLILFYLFKARSGNYNIYQFSKTFQLLWILFSALIVFILIYIFKIKQEGNYQLTFFKEKTIKKTFIISLLLIIATSFIFHSTLPILYKSGFGGDRLRHTGTERYLQQGNIVTPSLFGNKENVSMKKIGGITIPEVLVVGNKQSYGNKWTADIFISWIINQDVINIDKYLVFILWSIFVPIFFINIFKNFTDNEDAMLLFSLGSVLVSPLLIQGSQSDPRSFGILLFLFILTLFINKIKSDDFSIKSFIVFNIISLILLYFNYIVFLVVFIIFTMFYILLNKTDIKFKSLFIVILSFPILLLDIMSSQSVFIKQNFITVLSKIGEFFSNLFSFVDYSGGIYESSRNFIYFKSVTDGYGLNFPWIVNFAPFFSIIFILLAIVGVIYFYKKQEKYRFVVFSFLSLLLSYVFSYLFFSGVRIFAKRIEVVISIFLLLFFVYGILFILEKIKENRKNINIIIIPVIIFYSLFSASTLFSGPIMENATSSDFEAVKWLFDKIKNDDRYCIIGNTWPLLALEYESGSRIVTGGFPQGFEYSQKERVEIFNKMIKNPTKETLQKAKEITGAKKCFLLLKDDYVKSAYFGKINFIQIHDKYKKLLTIFKSNKDIGDVKIFIEE